MKLPKNYFENLNASKYREYLKLLPNFKEENTRIITTLIFTFLAMSFFGIFAINPTLSTIVTLRKQLSDSELVYAKLKTKIESLSSLQQQYNQLSPDLPYLFQAIPVTPQAPGLMGQIFALSKSTNVQVRSLGVSNVQIVGIKPNVNSSYIFSMEAQGSYENLINFAKSLTTFNRIVSIESLSITKDPELNSLILEISGRGYFKP